MANDDKLFDKYPSISDFEEILEDARMAACNDTEESFVAETIKKFESWGGRMYWSEKQDNWLRKIAGTE